MSSGDAATGLVRLRRAAPWLAVVASSVVFRLPSLLNAAHTTSDAAIVGLQAMQMLRGEWSVFLLGSGYQTSVDSAVAAAWFLLLGPTALALRLSTFAGHLALTLFAFATLRRHFAPWVAAACVLPLIFTPAPLHTYILYPPRQAALTLAVASGWLLDGASGRGGHEAGSAAPRTLGSELARFAVGAAGLGLACAADPYAMILVPPLGALGLLATLDDGPARRRVAQRALVLTAGAVAGLVPYWLLRHHPAASHGATGLDFGRIEHNTKLLLDECLPWLLSTKVQYARSALDYGPWEPAAPMRALQWVGAATLTLGVGSGAALAFARSIPWRVRRLGIAGFIGTPVTVAGFLVSVMVMDIYSARYLAAALLLAPFALAPAAWLLARTKRPAAALGVALGPFALSTAIAGWLSFTPLVDGLAIRLESGRIADERAVAALLEQRGIRHGMADYWVSYRLTFLFRERLVIVPNNEAEDRYAPYRREVEAAPAVAYVFDPLRSREDLERVARELSAAESPYEPPERVLVGRFTVFLLRRRQPAGHV